MWWAISKPTISFIWANDTEYRDGKLEVSHAGKQSLFARMTIRDGRHYFNILQSDGKWHTYRVDYTIGSKFQQAYATRLPNGEIHVFPIQYNLLQKRWINYWKIIDGAESERADPRTWEKLDGSASYQAICAVCHTSQLRNSKGGGFVANGPEFKEPGIGCEMCHGPSAQHAVEMAQNQFYPKTPLDPPVNFREAGNRSFVAICAQCHEQSAIRKPGPAGELNYSSSGDFFGNHVNVPFGEFSRKGFYKDGRFRQTTFMVEALERSQCFKKGQVSCGTCHEPHGHDSVSNPTALKFPGKPDLMCTGCHTEFQDSARAAQHSHHPAGSEGSRCVSCHMPRIMDALVFRARTHQIDDIPNAEMTRHFGQEDSPNACLLCHQEKSAEWVQQTMLSVGSQFPTQPKAEILFLESSFLTQMSIRKPMSRASCSFSDFLARILNGDRTFLDRRGWCNSCLRASREKRRSGNSSQDRWRWSTPGRLLVPNAIRTSINNSPKLAWAVPCHWLHPKFC